MLNVNKILIKNKEEKTKRNVLKESFIKKKSNSNLILRRIEV